MDKCPQCDSRLDWCPSGHYLCMKCGWQTEGCNHPKYLLNLDKHSVKNNVSEILRRLSYIEEQMDALIYTCETHSDVDRTASRLHSLIRSGFDAEIIIRRKQRRDQ